MIRLGKKIMSLVSWNIKCVICMEMIGLNRQFRLKTCKHTFCQPCLAVYCKTQIEIKELPITCPFVEGTNRCTFTLTESEIDHALDDLPNPEDGRAIFQRFKLFSNPRNRECPYCHHIQTHLDTTVPHVTCTACLTIYCFEHGHHPGQTCDEFLQRGKEHKQDILASEALIQKECKSCPKCNCHTSKNGGCAHMTCQICRTSWCWLCGQEMANVFEHYNADEKSLCYHRQGAEAITIRIPAVPSNAPTLPNMLPQHQALGEALDFHLQTPSHSFPPIRPPAESQVVQGSVPFPFLGRTQYGPVPFPFLGRPQCGPVPSVWAPNPRLRDRPVDVHQVSAGWHDTLPSEWTRDEYDLVIYELKYDNFRFGYLWGAIRFLGMFIACLPLFAVLTALHILFIVLSFLGAMFSPPSYSRRTNSEMFQWFHVQLSSRIGLPIVLLYRNLLGCLLFECLEEHHESTAPTRYMVRPIVPLPEHSYGYDWLRQLCMIYDFKFCHTEYPLHDRFHFVQPF